LKYDVTFPLSTKVDVNGDQASAIYNFLKSKTGVENIGWNFEKFLISKDGEKVEHFKSGATPEALESNIAALL
jgi:glutathione peroxidase